MAGEWAHLAWEGAGGLVRGLRYELAVLHSAASGRPRHG